MLQYPPPSRSPLLQSPASKAFLQTPDQWLSRELYFRSFAHTHREIWRLQMCSTIRPLLGAHSFSFLQVRHFWRALTSGSHLNFIVGNLLTHTHTDIGRLQMCSTIRPLPGALCFSLLQPRHFWKARTSGSHQNFIVGHLLAPTRRSGGSKCARLSTPFRGPTISASCK